VAKGISAAVDQFNQVAAELQTSEFRRARTPDEWQRMAKNPAKKDYAKLLGAVIPLIEAFEAASSSERAALGSKLSLDALGILRTFGHSMAVLAVRQESPELIPRGLTALVILEKADDVRDLTFNLATLHHSAMKLGMDTRKVFGDVASLASSKPLQNAMRDFPLREPHCRDLSAFHLRETATDVGFDIVDERRT
jgi:hypothetical protein